MALSRVSPSARIQRLLQTNTVMTVKQLRHALSGRSRSSLFRDLKQLDVITSYSHTGQYHALTSSAKFDPQGLWIYNDIGFAIYGTLKATLVQLIVDAQIGDDTQRVKDPVASAGAKHLNGFGDVRYRGATIASQSVLSLCEPG